MKKLKCKWLYVAVGVVILLVYSICSTDNIREYFEVPFSSLLSISVAFFFAFYITQRKNDERKRKDMHEKLIDKIYAAIDDEKMYTIKSEKDVKYIRIIQRSIRNRIDLLYDQDASWLSKSDLEYVKQEYGRYWDFISEKIDDIDYLEKSSSQLQMHIENMTRKLQEMMLKLYE